MFYISHTYLPCPGHVSRDPDVDGKARFLRSARHALQCLKRLHYKKQNRQTHHYTGLPSSISVPSLPNPPTPQKPIVTVGTNKNDNDERAAVFAASHLRHYSKFLAGSFLPTNTPGLQKLKFFRPSTIFRSENPLARKNQVIPSGRH